MLLTTMQMYAVERAIEAEKRRILGTDWRASEKALAIVELTEALRRIQAASS